MKIKQRVVFETSSKIANSSSEQKRREETRMASWIPIEASGKLRERVTANSRIIIIRELPNGKTVRGMWQILMGLGYYISRRQELKSSNKQIALSSAQWEKVYVAIVRTCLSSRITMGSCGMR